MASIPDHTLPFNALDDYSFNLAIYELQHGPVRYDPDRLSSLNYDPLFSSHNLSLTRSDDIDPDVNFCSDDVHCDYYIEDKFNEMLRNDNLCDEDFSLLHLNIRSLQRNLNSLSILLTCLNIKFSLIGVSETWLNDYSHSVDIDGFNFIHKHRPNRTGGGVGLYISDNLDFKIRADLSFDDIDVAESLFIEISRPHGKNIIGGVIYRPPNQRVGDFVSKHNDLLAKISRENKICFIMGDFNLNLINFQHHQNTGEFLDGLHSYMFFPMITRPTRITSHTATLLDNIFANKFFDHSRSGLLIIDVSDHLPVFSIHSNNDSSNSHAHDPVVIRGNNKENLGSFLEKLKEINWSSLGGYRDPKNAYNSFIKKHCVLPCKKIN